MCRFNKSGLKCERIDIWSKGHKIFQYLHDNCEGLVFPHEMYSLVASTTRNGNIFFVDASCHCPLHYLIKYVQAQKRWISEMAYLFSILFLIFNASLAASLWIQEWKFPYHVFYPIIVTLWEMEVHCIQFILFHHIIKCFENQSFSLNIVWQTYCFLQLLGLIPYIKFEFLHEMFFIHAQNLASNHASYRPCCIRFWAIHEMFCLTNTEIPDLIGRY